MPKKAKNKDWEKERRDRLNLSFDNLAKLLPQYDAKVPFSKIETIQRSIAFIEGLQKQLKELQTSENATTIMRQSQEELDERLQVMLVRNNMLLGLLRKANIPVPAFVGPKVIDNVVKQQENIKPNDECITKCKPNVGGAVHGTKTSRSPKKKKMDCSQKKASQVIKIKSNDPLEASESTKMHTLDSSKTNAAVSTTPVTISTPTTVLLTTTGILVPLVSHPAMPLAKRTNAGKRIMRIRSRMPKPIAGKVAIPALKNNVCFKVQWKRNRTSKKKTHTAQSKSPETDASALTDRKKCSESATSPTTKRVIVETKASSVANKRSKTSTNDALINDSKVSAKDDCSSNNKCASMSASSSCNRNNALSQPSDAELSNDLLASLQMPQNDVHLQHESLSPTAAFLMSFPVVSMASGGRIVDGDNNADTSSPQLMQLDDLPAKNQHNDHNLLDNISSLFTTKDYDRFVEDVAKNGNGAPRSSDDFFDFQLKPIANPRKLTVSVSTSLFTPDILPAPIYHNVSGYSTASLVALQPPPSMSSALFPTLTDLSSASCSMGSIAGPSFDFLNKKPNIRLNNECLTDNPGFTFSLTSTITTLPPTYSSCALANRSTVPPDKPYGFYDSLSTIGTSYSPTMTTTKSNQPVQPPVSTIYTSALSLSTSSANLRLPNASNCTQHAPFTFSLSATTTTKSVASSCHMYSAIATPSNAYNSQQKSQATSEHNTYNPFAFDNIPSIPSIRESVQPHFTFSLTSQTSTLPVGSKVTNHHHQQTISNPQEHPQFTFSLTSHSSTHPVDTLSKSHHSQSQQHTSSTTLNPFSIDYNILPDVKPKIPTELPFRLGDPVPPPPLNHKMFPTTSSSKMHHSAHGLPRYSSKNKCQNPRPPINWMTGTSSACADDFPHTLPSRSDMYFPPSVDETFTWSPNKLLDHSMGINSATLPTLHGDLALNTFAMKPATALQKTEKSLITMDTFLAPLAVPLPTSPPTPPPPPQLNIFSVINFVESRRSKVNTIEHSATNHKSLSPERRTKNTAKDSKRIVATKSLAVTVPSSNYTTYISAKPANDSPNIFIESFASYPSATEPKQPISTIYSAESLLSGTNSCTAITNTSKKDKPTFLSNPSEFYSSQTACVEASVSTFPNFDYSCEPSSGNNYNSFYNSSYLSQSYLENDYLGAAASTDVKHRTMHYPPPNKHCHATTMPAEIHTKEQHRQQVRPPVTSCGTPKKYKHDVFSMQPSYDPSSLGSSSYFGGVSRMTTPSSMDDYYAAASVNLGASVPIIGSSASASVRSTQHIGSADIKQLSSGNLVSNFNLSTICPEINDKIRHNNW